jgi:rubrerythrin
MRNAPGDGVQFDPAFLAGILEKDQDAPSVHLCALCDSTIEDPLEECPICAAELDSDGA